MAERRGAGSFIGTYRWFYHEPRRATFDTSFVVRLNDAAWVPDSMGVLRQPSNVLFEDIGWDADSVVQSKIHFRPPAVELLAQEVGIELGALDLLKQLGVTSEADLRARLGMPAIDAFDEAPEPELEAEQADVDQIEVEGQEEEEESIDDEPLPGGIASSSSGPSSGAQTSPGRVRTTAPSQLLGDSLSSPPRHGRGGAAHSITTRPSRNFVSYVAVQAEQDDEDPDGLTQELRMALEAKAIELVLMLEPSLQRTPVNNPGYDLFEPGPDDDPTRWIEVKAMASDLTARPVGMSQPQFELAEICGEAFWLYVVEYAGAPEQARLVKIQNPAGKAATFTFDKGWLEVAEIVESQTTPS
jgi:hypothetical protein